MWDECEFTQVPLSAAVSCCDRVAPSGRGIRVVTVEYLTLVAALGASRGRPTPTTCRWLLLLPVRGNP